jgi:uncharacterized membrane protein YkgB
MKRFKHALFAPKNELLEGRKGTLRASRDGIDVEYSPLRIARAAVDLEQRHRTLAWAKRLEAAGRYTLRYGLVLVLVAIGGMKFTAYEAEGISVFVANSPFMSWTYSVVSIRGFAGLLGGIEIAIALIIAARPLSLRASAVGSAAAVGMFLTTLSFLLTTPGVWEPSAGGFPALSVLPGQFLLKDVVLLGASMWLCGDDWLTLTKKM